jgi:hypothetical protein
MADISKLKEPQKKFNPTTPVEVPIDPYDQSTTIYGGPKRSNESMNNYLLRTGVTGEGQFNRNYGTNEANLKDMNEFSGRIPGLIQDTQTMAPRQSNAYGGDQHIYDAIDKRAQENYNQNIGSMASKLKQQDFEYRQNRLGQETQKLQAIRQYEQATQRLRDFQRQARKTKRGQVLGNVLGVVGAVVGGIFGGPMGASAGMQGGQAIGNVAGSA